MKAVVQTNEKLNNLYTIKIMYRVALLKKKNFPCDVEPQVGANSRVSGSLRDSNFLNSVPYRRALFFLQQ